MAAALLPAAVAAAELYRWVDEQGRSHVADRPPANPPANMTVEPMPDPDANTQQGGNPRPAGWQQSEPLRGRAVRPATQPEAAQPAPSTCEQRWAAYQRSQACFESYRTAEAGLKPEAFAQCGPEEFDPSPECGPPR